MFKPSLLLALLALGPSLAAAEPATVVRSSQIRSKPLLDAPLVTTLNQGDAVDLIANEGGWSKIKTGDGKTGFIRLLNIRPASAGSNNALSGIDKLGNVMRTGSSSSVATTGVKGISKDDIAQSIPNPEEVKKMEGYSVSAADAKKSAKSINLAQQNVPYLVEKP